MVILLCCSKSHHSPNDKQQRCRSAFASLLHEEEESPWQITRREEKVSTKSQIQLNIQNEYFICVCFALASLSAINVQFISCFSHVARNGSIQFCFFFAFRMELCCCCRSRRRRRYCVTFLLLFGLLFSCGNAVDDYNDDGGDVCGDGDVGGGGDDDGVCVCCVLVHVSY